MFFLQSKSNVASVPEIGHCLHTVWRNILPLDKGNTLVLTYVLQYIIHPYTTVETTSNNIPDLIMDMLGGKKLKIKKKINIRI